MRAAPNACGRSAVSGAGSAAALVARRTALLAELAAQNGPSIAEMAPSEAREFYRLMRPASPDLTVGAVEDRSIPGPAGDIPVRIYTPEGQGPFPILVNFYGGGWVIGDLDTADAVSRDVCRTAGCVVVSVDYRLAPEHPFPAAVDDAYAATVWVADNMRAIAGNGRLAVGRERGRQSRRRGVPARTGSGRSGHRLSAAGLPGHRLRLQPAFLHRQRSGLPPGTDNHALVLAPLLPRARAAQTPGCLAAARCQPVTAAAGAAGHRGVRPLRDEGEAFAAALRNAGVEAEAVRHDGLVHDFFATAQVFHPAVPDSSRHVRHCGAGLSGGTQPPWRSRAHCAGRPPRPIFETAVVTFGAAGAAPWCMCLGPSTFIAARSLTTDSARTTVPIVPEERAAIVIVAVRNLTHRRTA
jgi:acetyl esterase